MGRDVITTGIVYIHITFKKHLTIGNIFKASLLLLKACFIGKCTCFVGRRVGAGRYTPLHHAAAKGSLGAARWLLRFGGDAETRYVTG